MFNFEPVHMVRINQELGQAKEAEEIREEIKDLKRLCKVKRRTHHTQ